MRNYMKGFLFMSLWLGSIHSGFLLICCPIVPILLLSPKLYQRLIDIIISAWEMYPTALMQLLNGTKIVLSGDYIRPHEKSLLIMNHRTRCDWNFFWAGIYYASQPPSHSLKVILKAPIRNVPGPGWTMQMAGYLFIHRDWAKDQKVLAEHLDYYRSIGNTFQLLLFPEGTDLTPKTIERSNKFADDHNLPHLTKVLHPKTTGFTFLVNKMRQNKQLHALYDITVAYPHTYPQNELDLFRGKFPEEVHFHIQRYSEQDLPQEESQQVEWLKKSWMQKEESLNQFYSTKQFKDCGSVSNRVQTLHNALYLAFYFWTSIQVVVLYLTIYSSFFRWYTVFCILSFSVISVYTEGFQQLQVKYFNYLSQKIGCLKPKGT
ncbi:lysocardiolipin acyltransferase 1 [Bemisia tabaci]|uniref:lysocardiolipin acyltransferase 1 n=1 Tax=Bemisia tabaci TaxID=7038 RepID=UPI003B289F21